MKFSRQEFQINVASLRFHSTARAICFVFFDLFPPSFFPLCYYWLVLCLFAFLTNNPRSPVCHESTKERLSSFVLLFSLFFSFFFFRSIE